MTNEYGFFSSKDHDRAYSAEDICAFFRDFFTDGVLGGNTGELKVSADSGMRVKVSPGTAYIDGRFFRPAETKHIDIKESDGTYPRKDIIVIRCDYSARKVLIDVVEGIASASPKAPEPVRSGMVYELCIAEIYVSADALEITDADITDTRFDTSLCGIVTGAIDTIDTTDLFKQYQKAWELLMAGAALDEPEIIAAFNALTTVKTVNGVSPDENGNVNIDTKNIDNIPVDLTGIYNNQVIGYDEESGKLVPMNAVARTETVYPSTEVPAPYTFSNFVNCTIDGTAVTGNDTNDFSYDIITNRPYLMSEFSKLNIYTADYVYVYTSYKVTLSKKSDFSELNAVFQGGSQMSNDITAMKGYYYIKIETKCSNNSMYPDYKTHRMGKVELVT